jgi:hypothetical protein
MSKNAEQQEAEEMAVFGLFAKVCPLGLLANTAVPGNAQRREPDIFCELASGGQLAFELGQVEDVFADESSRGAPTAVTRMDECRDRLHRALPAAYDDALAAGKIELPARFNHCQITVHFQKSASCGRRERALSRAVALLNQLGHGSHAINERVIRAILCEPSVAPWSPVEPMFFVDSPYCHVAPAVADGISEKLQNAYASSYPIHLLAWSYTASIAESELWKQDVAAVLRSLGWGPYAHIWVFGVGESAIAWDSGPTPSSP